jgi:hypothetical protein
MNEKRGVIESGRTPAETDEKQASADSLADHLTKRAADAVAEKLQGPGIPGTAKAMD